MSNPVNSNNSIDSIISRSYCDYIPIASTITNLQDIYHKYAAISSGLPDNSPYHLYVANKSFARCTILLVPFVGNISVALYDCADISGLHEHTD